MIIDYYTEADFQTINDNKRDYQIVA